MEAVLVAIIGMVAAVAVARINNKVVASNERVMAKIQTNHGMEPWQYLEMVGDVRNTVLALTGRVDAYIKQDAAEHEEMKANASRVETAVKRQADRMEAAISDLAGHISP